MKRSFTKAISTLALSAVLAALPVVVPESAFTTTAHAAYSHDLNIDVDTFVEGAVGESTRVSFNFSGYGISGLAYTAENCDVLSWENAFWTPYPGICSIDCVLSPTDTSKDGRVTLFLKDDDGDFSYSKTVTISSTEIQTEDLSFPSSISHGKGQHIQGKIRSTKNIDCIEASVVNSSTNQTVLYASENPGSRDYNLWSSPIDFALTFGSLPVGEYTLQYRVWSSMRVHEYSLKFEVTGNSSGNASSFENALYSIAKNQVGQDYKQYGGDKTTEWCGYFVRYCIVEALKEMGYSETEAKSAIGYRYLGGALTAAYAYSNYDIGNYYSFADWKYSYFSNAIGKRITSCGKNVCSSNNFTPKVGDIALIETNGKISKDGPDHFGVVVKVNSDGSMVLAEGNTGRGTTATRKVKLYNYKKAEYGDITSWRREGCSGSTCLVLGICRPNIFN